MPRVHNLQKTMNILSLKRLIGHYVLMCGGGDGGGVVDASGDSGGFSVDNEHWDGSDTTYNNSAPTQNSTEGGVKNSKNVGVIQDDYKGYIAIEHEDGTIELQNDMNYSWEDRKNYDVGEEPGQQQYRDAKLITTAAGIIGGPYMGMITGAVMPSVMTTEDTRGKAGYIDPRTGRLNVRDSDEYIAKSKKLKAPQEEPNPSGLINQQSTNQQSTNQQSTNQQPIASADATMFGAGTGWGSSITKYQIKKS